MTGYSQATVSVMMSNVLICFCSFDLSCPILEIFLFYRKFVYCIVLNSVLLLTLIVSNLSVVISPSAGQLRESPLGLSMDQSQTNVHLESIALLNHR